MFDGVNFTVVILASLLYLRTGMPENKSQILWESGRRSTERGIGSPSSNLLGELLRRDADLAQDPRVDSRQHHPEQRTAEDIAGIMRA